MAGSAFSIFTLLWSCHEKFILAVIMSTLMEKTHGLHFINHCSIGFWWSNSKNS